MTNPFDILEKESQKKLESIYESLNQKKVQIPDQPQFTRELKRVTTYSDFVATSFIRDPLLLVDLITTNDLFSPYPRGIYQKRLQELLTETNMDSADVKKTFFSRLRRFVLREKVRIAWRDLSNLSDFHQTVTDLSDLADAVLDTAYSCLYHVLSKKNGFPSSRDGSYQPLILLGMGKLGGRELNFSSDVDLIFAYPEEGNTTGANPISNHDFFHALCRELIRMVGASSPEGTIFRMDLDLRPFGRTGPLVMNFDAMEDYYQTQGREWERYAWIKARPINNCTGEGRVLLDRIRPFVYRKYLDYGVFDGLRSIKKRIETEALKENDNINVKLSPGGIREIEFFVHIFQLTRGGVLPKLQESNLCKALNKIREAGFVSRETSMELEEAYIFLRNTEHRLQEFSDRQTHTLPKDDVSRLRLALSMGFDNWHDFKKELDRHMKNVQGHFSGILEEKRKKGVDKKETIFESVWLNNDPKENMKLLLSAGIENPGAIVSALDDLRRAPSTRALSNEGRERLDRLVPQLLSVVIKKKNYASIMPRIVELIKSIERRANYISLFLENPQTLTHLVELASASPWIIRYITRHPVLLDELIDPRTLYFPPDRDELKREADFRLENARDEEEKIASLCIFKHTNVLRVAAADITGSLRLMKVSDHLTYIAEVVLEKVLNLSWSYLVKKYGLPGCVVEDPETQTNFIIVGYGKLGGIELGYGSDLDLVFLHSGRQGMKTSGNPPLEDPAFFVRLGQRIIHTLATNTEIGKLYETDMRLRPNGSSGSLVANINSFRTYQEEKAWTWEHQAIVRARPVCGDPRLQGAFNKIRFDIITRKRNREELLHDVTDMRERMRRELNKAGEGQFDIKQGKGGLIDIEFLVQFLVLLHANQHPELARWTDNVRIIETLVMTGIMDKREGDLLKDSYITFRRKIHRLTLQEKRAVVPDTEMKEIRKNITLLWEKYLA